MTGGIQIWFAFLFVLVCSRSLSRNTRNVRTSCCFPSSIWLARVPIERDERENSEFNSIRISFTFFFPFHSLSALGSYMESM
jgi:hypothetical protein